MSYDIRKWTANAPNRRQRNRAVPWCLAGSLVLTMTLMVTQTIHPPKGMMPSLIGTWIPVVFMSSSPFARESWLTARGRNTFDEFERAVLAQACSRAYAVFLMLIGLLGLWAWNVLRDGTALPTSPAVWLGWTTGLLTIGVTLPVLFAEFMVPFPPTGDAEED